MTSPYYSSKNKKFNNFTVTNNFGNTYLFIRSGGKGFFNIAKCEVLAKNRCIPKGYAGIIPAAVPFHPEEVAYLIAQEEERYAIPESIDALLKELINVCPWISFPRRTGGKAKQK
jgi:hypothetical protein